MPESDVPDSPFQSTPPCAGGDVQRFCDYEIGFISIHAPLCGGRRQRLGGETRAIQFQSTPPCAGGRPRVNQLIDYVLKISIHAPLCGGRRPHAGKFCTGGHFNPRPPVRGATFPTYYIISFIRISIHAPLCGGRQRESLSRKSGNYFNPRPPVRGATTIKFLATQTEIFQSTPPCAGGDKYIALTQQIVTISIHAPLCGGRHKGPILD